MHTRTDKLSVALLIPSSLSMYPSLEQDPY